jgi:hypothetical protein
METSVEDSREDSPIETSFSSRRLKTFVKHSDSETEFPSLQHPHGIRKLLSQNESRYKDAEERQISRKHFSKDEPTGLKGLDMGCCTSAI